METTMSKKFKKRGSFKKTQEDWLVKEGIISEANRSPIVEEADYEDLVEEVKKQKEEEKKKGAGGDAKDEENKE